MKNKKILLTMLPLIILSGCNSNISPEEEKEHIHVFDQHVAATQYRASGTTCEHGSTYYCSCVCGEKGEETFEYGKPLDHDFKVTIKEAKTSYLVGEKFDLSSVKVELICNECKHSKEVNTSKISVEDKTLTSADKKVSLNIETENNPISIDLPITVDVYRLNKVDIYQNSSNKIMFSLGGDYTSESKSLFEEGELYISPNKNLYKLSSTGFTLTPNAQNPNVGTFLAEIDITDIPLSSKDKVINSPSLENVYYPHLLVKNAQGSMEEKDIIFPTLQTKEIQRTGDPNEESYILTIFNGSVPVFARATINAVPSFTYYYTTSDTTYQLPFSMTRGYMPVGVDIVNENGRAIYVLSGKHKGFTRAVDFLRCFSIYFYSYPSNYNPGDYYASFDGAKCNYLPVRDGLEFTLNPDGTGTFTLKIDITYYAIPSDASCKAYFTRIASTNSSGSNDAKCADTINNGKVVTIGSKKFTVLNSSSSSKALGWGTMSFKIESAI